MKHFEFLQYLKLIEAAAFPWNQMVFVGCTFSNQGSFALIERHICLFYSNYSIY